MTINYHGSKKMSERPKEISPFNSALETGLRSICILESNIELDFDIQHLLAFDHLIVHSGDITDGPESLHVESQNRNGELLIRRPIVESGLLLMESKGLISRIFTSNGISYTATEFAVTFLNSLTTVYVSELRSRAAWAVSLYSSVEGDFFKEVFNVAFDRWTTEFQLSKLALGGS